MLLVGFIFSAYLGIDKLFLQTSGRLITERPEFYIALATMIMGSQFFLAGFIGEIILRNRKIKKPLTNSKPAWSVSLSMTFLGYQYH